MRSSKLVLFIFAIATSVPALQVSAQSFCELAPQTCTEALHVSHCNTAQDNVSSLSEQDFQNRLSNYMREHGDDMHKNAEQLGLGLSVPMYGSGSFNQGSSNESKTASDRIAQHASSAAAHAFAKYSRDSRIVTCDRALEAFQVCMSQLIEKCAASGWTNVSSLNPEPGSFAWRVKWKAPDNVDAKPTIAGIRASGSMSNCRLPAHLKIGSRLPLSSFFTIDCVRGDESAGNIILDIKGATDNQIYVPTYLSPCSTDAVMNAAGECICRDGTAAWSKMSRRCLVCPATTHLGADDKCYCNDQAASWVDSAKACVVPAPPPPTTREQCIAENSNACLDYSKELLQSNEQGPAQCYQNRGIWIADRDLTCRIQGADSDRCKQVRALGDRVSPRACDASGEGIKSF